MNLNFYIIHSKFSVLSSLKRALRHDLYSSNLNGSIVIRNTFDFIKSLKSTSKEDIFIIEDEILKDESAIKHILEFNTHSTLIVLIADDYSRELINLLMGKGLNKFLKSKDFSLDIIKEYINNDIEGFEANYYLDKKALSSEKNREIDTVLINDKISQELNVNRKKEDSILENVNSFKKEKMKSYINKIINKLSNYNFFPLKDKEKFKRTVSIAGKRHVNIWGNYQFGCEFAYILSKEMPLKILLIDSNLLAPSIDMYFGIEKFSKSYEINDNNSYNTGLNIAIDAIKKNVLTKELLYDISKQHKKVKNLHFLTGSYNINNYEYYDSKSYLQLLSICKDSFDVVVTLSNENIYDLYTSLSIIKSDINIISMEAHYDNIRKINNHINFLIEKQNISIEKNFMVPFEYMKGVDVSLEYLEDLSICRPTSKISFSKERRSSRSSKKSFVERFDKKSESEYLKIISEIGYVYG